MEALPTFALEPEPAGFGHRGGVGEAAGHLRRLVRVAAITYRLSATLIPPAHHLRAQRHPGVVLQRPAGPGQRGEHRPVLLLEHARIEGPGAARPGPDRIVDVREHSERSIRPLSGTSGHKT